METALIWGLVMFMFGIGFNALISYMETRPSGHDGYTSLLVAAGVEVTLLSVIPMLGFDVYLIVNFFFICSGVPMILGSILRYVRRRDREALTIIEKVVSLEEDERDA